MRSTLEFVLNTQFGGNLSRFLSERGKAFHIVAPDWVREQIAPDSTKAFPASWSDVDEAIPPGKKKIIVVAEDAVREDTIAASLAERRDRSVYGLFAHIVPAMLCGQKGLAEPSRTEDLKRYGILCLPRTGSTYLCSVLRSYGAGSPKEHLHDPLAEIIGRGKLAFERAFESLESYSPPNAIFGTKLVSQFLLRSSRGRYSEVKRYLEWLANRGYKFVRLRRPLEDVVLSSYIAVLAKKWHHFGEIEQSSLEKLDNLRFGEARAWESLIRLRVESIVLEAATDEFAIAGFDYSEIENNAEAVAQKICRFLEIDPGRLKRPSEVGRAPVAAHGESATYGRFAQCYSELLEQRRNDVDPETVTALQEHCAISEPEAQRLVARHGREIGFASPVLN